MAVHKVAHTAFGPSMRRQGERNQRCHHNEGDGETRCAIRKKKEIANRTLRLFCLFFWRRIGAETQIIPQEQGGNEIERAKPEEIEESSLRRTFGSRFQKQPDILERESQQACQR